MPDTYDYITLLYRLKAAQTRIKELESGERYIHLQELHQKEYMAYERKLRRLTQDLAAAHRETIRVLLLPTEKYCSPENNSELPAVSTDHFLRFHCSGLSR